MNNSQYHRCGILSQFLVFVQLFTDLMLVPKVDDQGKEKGKREGERGGTLTKFVGLSF